jgi:hypothetical protein
MLALAFLRPQNCGQGCCHRRCLLKQLEIFGIPLQGFGILLQCGLVFFFHHVGTWVEVFDHPSGSLSSSSSSSSSFSYFSYFFFFFFFCVREWEREVMLQGMLRQFDNDNVSECIKRRI